MSKKNKVTNNDDLWKLFWKEFDKPPKWRLLARIKNLERICDILGMMFFKAHYNDLHSEKNNEDVEQKYEELFNRLFIHTTVDRMVGEVVTESKLGLDLLGKIITHKTVGDGIVVGYDSISGEPFAYFYSAIGYKYIVCFSHEDIISVR